MIIGEIGIPWQQTPATGAIADEPAAACARVLDRDRAPIVGARTAAEFHLRAVGVVYPGARTSALRGVDLTIAPGEAVALVGPSGAGKTTLLRLLGATLCPTAGRLQVAGLDVTSLTHRRLRRLRASIATVRQDLALVPNLRVVTNVLAGRLGRDSTLGGLRRVFAPRRAEVREVFTVLDRVGIADTLYQRSDRLSGGQRQRVAIARALYQAPSALLADEPVSSVDPARACDTIALLSAISRERGLTLVVSLHSTELARQYFPRLIGLRRHRVVFDQPSAAVDDETLRALYTLDEAELLGDG